MRIKAHLKMTDGRIICPKTGLRFQVDHCAACKDMTRIESSGGRTMVVCEPEVEGFSEALDRMVRA